MSLFDLLKSLSALETEIDDSAEITAEQCHAHFDAIKEIDVKVDSLLGYMDACKMRAAEFDAKAQEYKHQGQRWEKRLESLRNYCLFIIKSSPHITYRGKEKKMELKLNAPSLVCEIRKSFSSANVIPAEYLGLVPQRYLEEKTVWVLKTDVVREDLKSGTELSFARNERKESLQIKFKEDKK
jgi:Siphovirus Gp157